MISSSDNFTICREVGTTPASVFAAMSRMDLILAKENPQARICPSVTPARSSGRGNFRRGKQFFEPRENGVRRRAVELLVRHRQHQRLKRRTARFRLQFAWAVLADEPAHHRIAGGQMFVGGSVHISVKTLTLPLSRPTGEGTAVVCD